MCQAISLWFSSLTRSEWFDLISTIVGTVALAAAIAIAIFEHSRAVRASEDRVRDFRTTVTALVTTLNDKALEVEAHADDGDTRLAWDEWKVLAEDITAGLEAVLPSSPPRPEAIVAVAAMIRRLKQSETFRDIAFDPPDHVRHARSVRMDLAGLVEKLR